MRFDINASSLPDETKGKLCALADKRISSKAVIIIKAQRFRSQEKNRDDALERLKVLILSAMATAKKRLATKPSRTAKRKRLEGKLQQGKLKLSRSKVLE